MYIMIKERVLYQGFRENFLIITSSLLKKKLFFILKPSKITQILRNKENLLAKDKEKYYLDHKKNVESVMLSFLVDKTTLMRMGVSRSCSTPS
jgi:hypothetical protein